MKSVIASAALCAGIFAESSMAASLRHQHLHHHAKRSAAPVAAPVEKRVVQFISPQDTSALSTHGVMLGANVPSPAGGPVTVGDNGGPFVVEFNNQSPDDIIVVVWGSYGQQGAVDSSFIGANQPAVTTTLQSNTTTYVSFDPSLAPNNAISGAWGAIYPGASALTPFSGQLDNTIGEYTFTTASQFSTTDISRLINMNGNKQEIHNFATKADAQSGASAACSATMTEKAFVCPSGQANCIVGSIIGCTAGEENTTCNSSGMDGGCGGLTAEGGYIVTNFF